MRGALMMFLLVASALSADPPARVEIPELKSSFSPPPGYVSVPHGKTPPAWAWEKAPEGVCGRPIRLLVYPEHEEVKPWVPDAMDKLFEKGSPRPTVEWKGFQVPVQLRIEKPETVNRVLVFIDVPLSPRGLRVEMSVPKDRIGESGRDLRQLVASIEGTPTWLTPGQQKKRWIWLACGLIGIPLTYAYFFTWLVKWRGKPEESPGLRYKWLLIAGSLLMAMWFLERSWRPEGSKGSKSSATLTHAIPMLLSAAGKFVRARERSTGSV